MKKFIICLCIILIFTSCASQPIIYETTEYTEESTISSYALSRKMENELEEKLSDFFNLYVGVTEDFIVVWADFYYSEHRHENFGKLVEIVTDYIKYAISNYGYQFKSLKIRSFPYNETATGYTPGTIQWVSDNLDDGYLTIDEGTGTASWTNWKISYEYLLEYVEYRKS